MTERQQRAILDFTLGRIGGDAVSAALGFDIDGDAEAAFRLLVEAARVGDAASIECALLIARDRTADIDLVPTLIALLGSPRHREHEEIALWLQDLRDPRAVDALHAAALAKHAYLEHDSGYALARKCTWALADIGTIEAQERLRRLADGADREIAGYARKRLDGWTEELARKGRRARAD
jgi:hypothetical protein